MLRERKLLRGNPCCTRGVTGTVSLAAHCWEKKPFKSLLLNLVLLNLVLIPRYVLVNILVPVLNLVSHT